MTGDILLKMVSVMTVDDVRECKRLGLEAEVRDILDLWDRMAIAWRAGGVVETKLNELRAELERRCPSLTFPAD